MDLRQLYYNYVCKYAIFTNIIGRYPHTSEYQHINRTESCNWLITGNMVSETEGFICAILRLSHYYAIPISNIVQRNHKFNTCRLCGRGNENFEHIIAASASLHCENIEAGTTTLTK